MSRATPAYFDQRYADFDKRLAEAPEALGRGDGAVQGLEGRHVSPLVAELRRPLRTRHASATSSRGPAFRRRRQHTLDLINEMKRQNVKLMLVEPYFDLKTPNVDRRETGAEVLVHAALGRRREGR